MCWWEASSSSSSNPFVNKMFPDSSLQDSVLSGLFGDDDLGLCVSLFWHLRFHDERTWSKGWLLKELYVIKHLGYFPDLVRTTALIGVLKFLSLPFFFCTRICWVALGSLISFFSLADLYGLKKFECGPWCWWWCVFCGLLFLQPFVCHMEESVEWWGATPAGLHWYTGSPMPDHWV